MEKKEEKIDWFLFPLPTTPLLKCDLNKQIMDYLWSIINTAKKDEEEKNSNKQLAGNISKSLYLDDVDNYFFNVILKDVCKQYIQENNKVPCFRNSLGGYHISDVYLKEFWVNFSKQNEFNPLHDHSGVLSFVIWMDIPTKSEDQYEIPIAKNSALPSASDFQLTYTDITGAHRAHTIPMDPSLNGTMILFPSTMPHQVYPFYNCEKERVSISGNLYYKGSFDKE
tara:strand:- start:64 stop:738 length:675 start_codon:yes stop_codon:yes gene_type:complete